MMNSDCDPATALRSHRSLHTVYFCVHWLKRCNVSADWSEQLPFSIPQNFLSQIVSPLARGLKAAKSSYSLPREHLPFKCDTVTIVVDPMQIIAIDLAKLISCRRAICVSCSVFASCCWTHSTSIHGKCSPSNWFWSVMDHQNRRFFSSQSVIAMIQRFVHSISFFPTASSEVAKFIIWKCLTWPCHRLASFRDPRPSW
jgi:hypothetical protein